MPTTTKPLTVKAKKGNTTIEQVATSEDQKKRWEELFIKNGFRVVKGKRV